MSREPTSAKPASGSSPTVGPWSSSWVRYYDLASRRRHRMGGYKRLREEARRKRRIELLAMAGGGAGVFVLVAIFYTILAR